MMMLRTGATERFLADPIYVANREEAEAVARLGLRSSPVRHRYWCRDGFTLSIQAHAQLQCRPQSDAGPWSAVEVGRPSRVEPLLMPWIEGGEHNPDTPTSAIYAYVPLEVVDTIIAAHEAAARVAAEDPAALVMVEALREHGVVASESPDVNRWSVRERVALAHALAILDAFG